MTSFSLASFPLARLNREGIPVFTAPEDRLLGLVGWEGRAFVAHLLTEFFDPWEHFYDQYRTKNPRHLLPTDYRLREIAEATRDVHFLDGAAADQWTDAWLAERLLRLRPPLSLLTTFVRRELEENEPEEDPADIAAAVRVGDDDTVLERCLSRLPADELQAPDPTRSIPAFVCGDDGALRWHAPFVERLGGADSERVAHVVGRCLANRDWRDLDGWLIIDETSGVVELGRGLFDEMRKQVAGARTQRLDRVAPFLEEMWLRWLIRARMMAACVNEEASGTRETL